MNPRNTILMLILVLGVGGFWYWHDIKGGQQRQETKEKEERLFPDLEAKDITSLRLAPQGDDKGKEPTVLEKVDGRWLLRGTPDVLASQEEIGGTVDQVAELKRESVILESPAPKQLGEYGLEKPRYVLEIATGGEGQPKRLLTLGDKTPDEAGYYALTSESGPVVEVPASFMAPLEKPAAELREKNAMAAEPARVNRIRMVTPSGEEILLVKDPAPEPQEGETFPGTPETWRLEKPLQAPADGRKVSDFLFAWRNLRAGRFLAADEKVDFGKPRLRLEVWEEGSQEPRVLEVGPPVAVKPEMAYLRRLGPDEGMVVELGPQEKELLGQAAADFEDRHLLSFREDQVDLVEGKVNGHDLKVRRIRDGWEVEKPAKASKDTELRNSAVGDLLYSLKDLSWTAKEGKAFEEPRATLTLKKKGGEVLGTLRVGPVGSGGETPVRRGDSEQVFTVQGDPVQKWIDVVGRLEERPSPTPGAGSPAPAAGSPSPAAQ